MASAVPSFAVAVEGAGAAAGAREATVPRWPLEYLGRLFVAVGAVYMSVGIVWLFV